MLFKSISRCCAALLMAGGAVVLLGWAIDNEFLRGGFSQGITVKTNAALCMMLAGGSLWGLNRQSAPARRRMSVQIPAAALVLIAVLTLVEHLTGRNLAIDELLFQEPAGMPGTSSPNRMGLPGSLCFAFIGAALLMLNSGHDLARRIAQHLAAAVGAIAFLPILGYAYGVTEMYGIAGYTAISLPTAVLFVAASIGVISADISGPFLTVARAPTSGGMLVRRLLLPAILAPAVLGFLILAGGESRLYEPTFGVALLVISLVVVFAVLVWLSGRLLHSIDLARTRAEEAEQETNAQLQLLLESERHAREDAERAGRMKDEFLSTLSHELRTPLNAILGYATLLRMTDMDQAELDDAIAIIERNAKLQAKLIEDLLDMNRIISGKIRLEVQSMRPAEAIHGAIETVRLSAEAKGVTLRTAKLDGADAMQGDPARIQQIIWNLLSNAIKFTPAGGVIDVSTRRFGSELEIAVRDSGEGIEPAFLPFVFDRFRQADASTTRRHGGLGIGLAIVKHLAELHGGSVRVESAGRGRGATFIVRLPLVVEASDVAPADRPAVDESSDEDGADSDLTGVRILVVDDERDGAAVVKRVLEKRSAEVDATYSAEAALERLRERRYDLLISDIGMPGDDGYQLLQAVRANETPNRGVPAIALTAFARAEDREQAFAAGFQHHLAKPVQAGVLISTALKLVGRNGVRKQR